MFIYSLKASTLKFFGIIGIALASIVALMFLIPSSKQLTTEEIAAMNSEISFNNVKSAKDGEKFLAQYGWTLDENIIEECEIKIPSEFDKVMTEYNEIQKQQGLDLTKYKKKTAQRYTYKVTNYPNYEGTIYANIITYRGKVIGGDICTADEKGFLHTFRMPEGNN